jgi:peptidylprolyl isomerase
MGSVKSFATLLGATILTGCSQCSNPKTPVAAPPAATPAASASGSAAEMAMEISEPTTGKGAEASDGKTVSILYKATFLDGSMFDQRLTRTNPLSFKLGSHTVITGLDVGLKGMKVGGRRRLVIPPGMAYGTQGFGNVVPPVTPVVFEVELIKVE